MATLSAKVFKHHKKADGTYNVKICVYHKTERVFMDTEHYVSDKKLTKSLEIKDTFILKVLNNTLDGYREEISRLGNKLDFYTAKDLKEYLSKSNESVDFLQFCQIHINTLKANGQVKSATNYNTVANSLQDFFNRKSLPIEEITLRTLYAYERYLRGARKMERTNQFGKTYTIETKGISDAGVHNYLRDFRGLFSAAMAYYNKPSLGITLITYSPFTEYKIVDAPETKKRNIEIEQVKLIRDCKVKAGSRAELARDMFMLSFYLCGINAVDLYHSRYVVRNGRMEYNRSKTKGKRKDKAFISIQVPSEAVGLLSKYGDCLGERYATIGNLNAALSEGMVEVCKTTELSGITYYWARHTFGNLARNKCRMSKDDVALALNHVDHGRTTTDIYLDKDWSIVDEVQDAVLNLLRSLDKKQDDDPFATVRILFNQIELPKLQA
ncbi:site-specific integrase [Mucilaginibacter paludis]|uniref:Phage integrase SAM-like domain-containing protein n=1 Tax=Mucilaginibacter paludis DSM 18603 TaxID=714943 RepID=H1YI65_9SPHI|nr:site-specific integrase [Mucilaginibacter paludis]EHQ26500.1 hypothetical protein Mucpa_2370 [Mucilaginibacter paludis DSM 18603]